MFTSCGLRELGRSHGYALPERCRCEVGPVLGFRFSAGLPVRRFIGPHHRARRLAHGLAGLNRRRTAAARHVHPNTIDYRLRRIADLTGLDATDPARTAHIQAALTALEASADQRT